MMPLRCPNADLYDADFVAWCERQATLLQQGAWAALDLPQLIEEVLEMARRDRRRLARHLELLLTHLLKLAIAGTHDPATRARAGRGWQLTCQAQRLRLARLLREAPSLRPVLRAEVAEAWPLPCLAAARGLPGVAGAWPAACPWTVDEVLDNDFWPETPR